MSKPRTQAKRVLYGKPKTLRERRLEWIRLFVAKIQGGKER